MKLFRSDQIKQIDGQTIAEEPVAPIDLMERAAGQLLQWYLQKFERSSQIFNFVGPGNNGGDGLALARLLSSNRYDVTVCYVEFTQKTSEDWKINFQRLKNETNVKLILLSSTDQFPKISEDDVIIDALLGTGLTRTITGLAADIIKLINDCEATVISIDIPSGMFGEDNSGNDYESVVSADFTLSFQFPKLSFMFSENAHNLGDWIILPIGLSTNVMRNTISPYTFLERSDAAVLLKKRNKFDHKGTYGHGLLISGSFGKTGSAVLGAGAALRTGLGLITCHTPKSGVMIIQSNIPEAMVIPDTNENHLSEIGNTDSFSAIGIGPGIGTEPESQIAMHKLLEACTKPMVIDADGLNILSLNKNWFSLIPERAILTPHPKEFERLAGQSESSFERLTKQIGFSKDHKCIVILKGANTSITTPDGNVYFNSTGNPGMATAGSGDVLTGILLSLLSQGYTPENAAILGVYLHGLAGDLAAEELCFESIIASDIINNLSAAFNKLREE
jgi:NAD(P)H-hydrate epimerase